MSTTGDRMNALPVPDLEQLSRDQLITMLKLYSKLFLAMDGFWYLAVKELVSEDKATDSDLWVWDKYARYEMKRLLPAINVKGDNLGDFATAFGYSPWFSNLNHRFTREGEDKLTLTVIDCPSMEAIKREGTGREKAFCSQVEHQLFQYYVKAFDPRARVVPVELPLKPTKDSICCRWQFVIDR